MAHRILKVIKEDPRHYQIGALTFLLIYGLAWLDFEVRLENVALILAATLLTQYLCTRLWKLPAFDPRSSLISGLSLCLLLRTNEPALAVAAGILAVTSKFVRLRGKHLFNPTNFALVVLMLLTDQVWVSASQWGSGVLFAFLLACIGGLVVNRAARSDVSLAFLGFYSLLLLGRSAWLGEPLTIPLHRLQSGALLLFSFFMISDPKTTPNSRASRILFALVVALGTGYVQFVLFRTNGLLWSLAACAFAVPWLDRFFPADRYQWSGSIAPKSKDLRQSRTLDFVNRSKRPELEPLKAAGFPDSPFEGGRRLPGGVLLKSDAEARQRDIPLHPLKL